MDVEVVGDFRGGNLKTKTDFGWLPSKDTDNLRTEHETCSFGNPLKNRMACGSTRTETQG